MTQTEVITQAGFSSVEGELCTLARVTGPAGVPPSPFSPVGSTLPASYWPVPRGGIKDSACPVLVVIVQELCESRGERPGLSVLTSLLVSVDVKIYCTVLRHWSQLVPNMSHDI